LYQAEMDMFVEVLPVDVYDRNATVSICIYRPMIPHQGGMEGIREGSESHSMVFCSNKDRNSSRKIGTKIGTQALQDMVTSEI
jgi:hypothetical protein